jgi:hypothetical protein
MRRSGAPHGRFGSKASFRACSSDFRFAPDTGRIAASQRTDAKGHEPFSAGVCAGRPLVPQKETCVGFACIRAERALCTAKSNNYGDGFSGILKVAFWEVHLKSALQEDPFALRVFADVVRERGRPGVARLKP